MLLMHCPAGQVAEVVQGTGGIQVLVAVLQRPERHCDPPVQGVQEPF